MANSKNGDMMTVLRHLVEQTNWQGNHGARSETQDAMDRLMGGNYDTENAPETPETPETPKGSPTTSAAKRNTGTR